MKTYVVTTAQANARVNPLLAKSLERFVEEHEAETIILPTIGKSGKEDWTQMHPSVHRLEDACNGHVLYDERKLNDNLKIAQFNVRPQQIDPITGLNRFAQKDQSTIFASPKQRIKYVPHSNHKMPKALLSTGAITEPNYANGEDVAMERRRLGSIAQRDHQFGAVVVNVLDDKNYHMRFLRANGKGKFADLGQQYVPHRNPYPCGVEAFIAGDWHTGANDPIAVQATMEQIELLQPKRLVLHDFFDGHSVNPHSPKEWISSHIREVRDKMTTSLEEELSKCGEELYWIYDTNNGRDVYIVDCNHHDFLGRWLNEGMFMKDAENSRIGLYLANKMMDGENPVKAGIEYVTGGKLPKNVRFLDPEQDLKVYGWALQNHGHKGACGGRGNISQQENSFGKSISGHRHSLEVLRDTFVAGTQKPLVVHYMKGAPSNWTHSNIALYNTGQPQPITSIEGKWNPSV